MSIVFLHYKLSSHTTFYFDPKPLCTIHTPNSILLNKQNYRALFIDGRQRYATCTGAVWLDKHHLATLNLYGKKINTYRFDEATHSFHALQEITDKDGSNLRSPENLTISSDGRFLAVCSDLPDSGINIYAVDPTTHYISPKPILQLLEPDMEMMHNVRFSKDNKFLVAVGANKKIAVYIYSFTQHDGQITVRLTHTYNSPPEIVATKATIFTTNAKFIIISYGGRASSKQKEIPKSALIVHEFDHISGKIGNIVCSIDAGLPGYIYEDIALINNDTILIASDQNNDALTFYNFDPNTGIIDPNFWSVQNPDANLFFPHGIALHPDGNAIVVTNYGSDSFNLYRLKYYGTN